MSLLVVNVVIAANKTNNTNPIINACLIFFNEILAHFIAIKSNNLLYYALQQTYADEKNNIKIYIGTKLLELFYKIFPSKPYFIVFHDIHVVIHPSIHNMGGPNVWLINILINLFFAYYVIYSINVHNTDNINKIKETIFLAEKSISG